MVLLIRSPKVQILTSVIPDGVTQYPGPPPDDNGDRLHDVLVDIAEEIDGLAERVGTVDLE